MCLHVWKHFVSVTTTLLSRKAQARPGQSLDELGLQGARGNSAPVKR